MRLLKKLLVLIFVRRETRAHARAVLGERAAKTVRRDTTLLGTPLLATQREQEPPAECQMKDAEHPVKPAAPQTPREALIAEALAVRKSREAEWDALTPAQKSRAVAGLGEGMEAIIKTFRAA